jgi:hypothetical protein
MKSPPFYLVWAAGRGAPVVKHETQGKAEKEAERLASLNPGDDFYVLQPVMRLREVRVEREHYETDQIPF